MGLGSSKAGHLTAQQAQFGEFVKEAVSTNPIVMFSKSTCPYCRIAKSIFGELGTEIKVFELDQMEQGSQLQDVLEHMTSARTVPRVFIKGQCIGGCSELKSLHQSGRLKHML